VTGRAPFLLAAFAVAATAWPGRAQEPKHLDRTVDWNVAPVSDSMMSARLRFAAAEYRQYAPVPRLALFDIAYPATAAEYSRLAGHAVLLVTAVTQDSAELPLAQVYVQDETDSARVLPFVRGTCGRLSTSEAAIGEVFGKFRCDALYLLPVIERTGTGEVLADFAVHRRGFRLLRFDGTLPPSLRDLPVGPPGPDVDAAALRAFIAREFPAVASRAPEP